jgi:hypothetical protein
LTCAGFSLKKTKYSVKSIDGMIPALALNGQAEFQGDATPKLHFISIRW